ncbi:OpgC domain-containing protein [Cupriavidus pauculus]|uniref:OpgC domain-containing protein n=1 Tax=Cupriavidus pauculus TaxID=82633 RepID=UPI000784C04A|nr:OpgC domain-containing protein [Cupriavidus pauculus]MBY4732730.1 OpgC domain-containing protein [Cupriavidus pauculus]
MNAVNNNQRRTEVDLIRGIALLFIVVDHVNGSVLADYTIRNFQLFDAAEVFVFLAGYSAGAAYLAMEARDGASAARKRMRRRSWEIYQAFVLTGVLMLLFGLVLALCKVPAPAVRATEAPDFMAQPLATLLQVIGLVRQPFVSDVLPMYAVFIGLAPLSIRWARAQPLAFACASVALWIMSPTLLPLLPSSEPRGWSFNPFAWQLMFGMGLLARLRPDFVLPQQAIVRRAFTIGALVVALLCMAAAYLWMRPHLYEAWLPTWLPSMVFPLPKQSLAALRVVSFLGLAWLVYLAIRAGWVEWLARFMGPVVQIGRHSLFCFVLGAVVSVGIEGLTYGFAGGRPARPVALGGDIVAVALLLVVGGWYGRRKEARRIAAKSRPASAQAA